VKTYDKASWHSDEGDFPDDLDERDAGTPMGMFLAWAAEQGLLSDTHTEDNADALRDLLEREITGRDYVFDLCDGKLTDEDFNKLGNQFARAYYDKHFMDDFVDVLGDDEESPYHVEDSWDNFDALKEMLDDRFEDWKRRKGID
jgi:hypothetical protein